MELRFVGKDGSMGLRNGRVYKTKIWSDKRYIWVTAKIGIFEDVSCPYETTIAFAKNWELVR